MKAFSLAVAASLFAGAAAQQFNYTQAPSGNDKCALINVVMDESGSMSGEQGFMRTTALPRMSQALHSSRYGYDRVFLCSTGFTNRYQSGRTTFARNMGCTTISANGTIANSRVAAWTLTGWFEDGWHALMNAINSVPAVIEGQNLLGVCGRIDKNLILVTDEDRDRHSSQTVTQVKNRISSTGYVLNCIVNILIDRSNTNVGMQIAANETTAKIFTGYGSNFTRHGVNYKTYVSDFGSTHADYSELIEGTTGAIWNINSLRAGGNVARGFADTFVAVKVEEISAGCANCANGPVLTSAPSTSPTNAPVSYTTTQQAGTNGDPHFKTWKHEHFEFHGQCDMILAKDPEFASGIGLDVQIRTKMVRFWSYIQTAAVRIGDDILEIKGSADDDDRDTHYWFNFQYQAEATAIGGFPLTITSNGNHKRFFEIDLSSKFPGQKIVLSVFKEFVAVDFKEGTTESFGNAVGMLGDYKTGKTLARDGSEMDDFNEYGNEWQLLPSDDMLFHDKAEPQFPKRCILPEDPQGQRRRRLDESSISVEKAEAVCATLKDPLTIKDCVYDILATQDLDMVGAF